MPGRGLLRPPRPDISMGVAASYVRPMGALTERKGAIL
jgi:hypothetical protein